MLHIKIHGFQKLRETRKWLRMSVMFFKISEVHMKPAQSFSTFQLELLLTKVLLQIILGAKKTGKDACEKFVEERLAKVEFFAPITKNYLKSFGTMAKQVKVNLKKSGYFSKSRQIVFCKTHCDGTKIATSTCEMCCHIPWDLYFDRLL